MNLADTFPDDLWGRRARRRERKEAAAEALRREIGRLVEPDTADTWLQRVWAERTRLAKERAHHGK